jgi:hypothetical protein
LQGDSPSLLGTSDSTGSEAYPGSSQCTSRHTVTFSSTSEHGMGTTISNKENLPAKKIQVETMSASLVCQISYYGSIACCQNQRFEMESCPEMRQCQMNCFHLQQVTFNAIRLLWGRPHLDLFATSLNHKLNTFASPVPDPLAYEEGESPCIKNTG